MISRGLQRPPKLQLRTVSCTVLRTTSRRNLRTVVRLQDSLTLGRTQRLCDPLVPAELTRAGQSLPVPSRQQFKTHLPP